MSEPCEMEPGRECHNTTRLALLEKRVDGLETGQSREEAFRKTYYAERDERIQRDARLDAKIDGMDEKLDKVVAYQEAEQSKPNRLLNKLKENALWMVLAAVIGMVLAHIGL